MSSFGPSPGGGFAGEGVGGFQEWLRQHPFPSGKTFSGESGSEFGDLLRQPFPSDRVGRPPSWRVPLVNYLGGNGVTPGLLDSIELPLGSGRFATIARLVGADLLLSMQTGELAMGGVVGTAGTGVLKFLNAAMTRDCTSFFPNASMWRFDNSIPNGGCTLTAKVYALDNSFATQFAIFRAGAPVWSFWQGLTGLSGGRRYTYTGTGPNTIVAKQVLVSTSVLSFRPPLVARDPHTQPDPTEVRIPRVRETGFRRKAVDVTLTEPGFPGGPPKVTRSPGKHREVPTREKKVKVQVIAGDAIRAYHKLTEIFDLVDALAKAIPHNPCGNLPGFAKMVCVLKHWPEIDPLQAAKNIVVNEIEDQVVGAVFAKLGAVTKAGGPSTTQITGYIRNLMQ